MIYEINYLIELQKLGREMVVTQTDTAKPKYGKYLPSLIEEKVTQLLGLLIQVRTTQKEEKNAL